MSGDHRKRRLLRQPPTLLSGAGRTAPTPRRREHRRCGHLVLIGADLYPSHAGRVAGARANPTS